MDSMNIIFIDGKCLICNRLVKFIYRIDHKKKVKFCNLQDPKALNYLQQDFVKNLSTVVFYQNGKLSTKSDAVIAVMDVLGHGYFNIFKIVPKVIRNWLYELVANNRYRIGEEMDTCPIPDSELAKRFL
ncbi:thiol-disulfide oxidoreductase DCC family protein [Halobacteriovorax sp. RT-2-5]|uniref:thiol-disulfide oxidoreductase DCC family protein n=2 Tax=unclassified Halobacteriovorax TaxID=2639665 RepID=UPI00399AE4A7